LTKVAVVTGGTRGIGLAITKTLKAQGYAVAAVYAGNEAAAEAARKDLGVLCIKADVGDFEAVGAAFAEIENTLGPITVLVNNAGIQNWMNVSDDEFYQKSLNEINTNVVAPLHLTQLFLNLTSLNTIINVTSGLSFVPLTKVPVYSATKAFFHSFTLSLRYLLKSKNVEVIEVIPPALNTDLGGKGLHDGQPPVSAFVESVFNQFKENKTEITFGFSEMMANANPDAIRETFNRMNP
jgi:uncharacterized oxidoreductase